ncbi:MAG: methyltransferase domain-containing protein [Pseudomonadota bacterium]
MADPFQDVDAAGPEFIKTFADAMDMRQADPTMEAIVAEYLDQLTFASNTLTVEVGVGAGAVSRRVAARAAPGKVIGFEPSKGFVAEAKDRAQDHDNLSFAVADGAQLPLEDGVADHVIMHTVLTHVPDPAILIGEAQRVLKPYGQLVICDCDFSKGSFASFPNDPLESCAKTFAAEFVTDPFVVAKLRSLVNDAGFAERGFKFKSRIVSDGPQMLPWVSETGKMMVARGQIGEDLAAALVSEYQRRAALGQLYGYQVFASLIAAKA